MTWQPLTEEELHDMLNSAWERMSLPQRRLWEAIRIEPQKWASHPYGDEGGGFWAVALLGQTVVWFNDIEDGFNRSRYTTHGTIGAYWCNQTNLSGRFSTFSTPLPTAATTGHSRVRRSHCRAAHELLSWRGR